MAFHFWFAGLRQTLPQRRTGHAPLFPLNVEILEDRLVLSALLTTATPTIASQATAAQVSDTSKGTSSDSGEIYIFGDTDQSSGSQSQSTASAESKDDYPVPPPGGPALQGVVALQNPTSPVSLPGRTSATDVAPVQVTLGAASSKVLARVPVSNPLAPVGPAVPLPVMAATANTESNMTPSVPPASPALSARSASALDLLFSLNVRSDSVDGFGGLAESPVPIGESPFARRSEPVLQAEVCLDYPIGAEGPASAIRNTGPASPLAQGEPEQMTSQAPGTEKGPAPAARHEPKHASAWFNNAIRSRYEIIAAAFVVSSFLAWSHWYPYANLDSTRLRLLEPERDSPEE